MCIGVRMYVCMLAKVTKAKATVPNNTKVRIISLFSNIEIWMAFAFTSRSTWYLITAVSTFENEYPGSL